MAEKRVKLKDSEGNILKPYNPDKQDVSNMVQDLNDASENTYPSTQAVANAFEEKVENFTNNLVHKTGDEHITGIKTFSTQVRINTAGNTQALLMRMLNYEAKTTATSDLYNQIRWDDKNGQWLSHIGFNVINNSKTRTITMGVQNDNVDATTELNFGWDSGGNRFFTAPRCRTANLTSTTSVDVITAADLNTRLNSLGAYIKESYHNGTDWYRVWSDGFIEQGGLMGNNNTITYLKPFSDTNYTVTYALIRASGENYTIGLTKTTTTLQTMSSGGATGGNTNWRASGY